MINKRLKDALFIDQWSELCMDTLGRFGYVLVSDMLLLKKSVKSGLSPISRTLSNTESVVLNRENEKNQIMKS